MTRTDPAKFQLGQVVSTPQAVQFCLAQHIDIFNLLRRHASGDWGDLSLADRRANDAALIDGSRILSAYQFKAGAVWVLTEAADDHGSRASTCVMLPSDY